MQWILGALITICCCFVISHIIGKSYSLMDLLDRIRVKLELKISGKYDKVPVDGEKAVQYDNTRASWQFRKDNVGVFAIQGRRAHMEDRFNVVSNLEKSGTSIYGVFDGHGGEFAAEFIEKTLFKLIMIRILKAIKSDEECDINSMLCEAITAADQQLLEIGKSIGDTSDGTPLVASTTALIAVHHRNKLHVANVGDSRGILCDWAGNVTPLSTDHKPSEPEEKQRIQEAGGYVSFSGVWRVSGILAMSRALGDYPLKKRRLIVADPDVQVFDLDQLQPSFVILATDGLWDVFSNEEACAFVRERLDEPHFGAKSIVLKAFYRGSLDNISAMVIRFPELP